MARLHLGFGGAPGIVIPPVTNYAAGMPFRNPPHRFDIAAPNAMQNLFDLPWLGWTRRPS
ncbi:MAG: hypothetical protein WCE69_14460 [Aestuariivirga sp.]